MIDEEVVKAYTVKDLAQRFGSDNCMGRIRCPMSRNFAFAGEMFLLSVRDTWVANREGILSKNPVPSDLVKIAESIVDATPDQESVCRELDLTNERFTDAISWPPDDYKIPDVPAMFRFLCLEAAHALLYCLLMEDIAPQCP